MTTEQAVVRLREAALTMVRFYPHDYKRCLRDRKKRGQSCRMCAAVAELAAAAKGVNV
jgi:hypothetical protein